jgi:two-component system, NarL family, response regulator NreC
MIDTQTISVVLADDHALILDGLRALLGAAAGIEVVGLAKNGDEAARLIRERAPDIAIVDLAMPGLNGLDVIATCVSDVPQCRFIVLSMYSTEEHIARALRSGAQGYVLKESAGDEVIAAVRGVAAGQLYLSARIAAYRERIDALLRADKSPLEALSERERHVLQRVVEGATSAEIAASYGISHKTVDTYRSRLMAKLGIDDLPTLVKFAVQHGLTPP